RAEEVGSRSRLRAWGRRSGLEARERQKVLDPAMELRHLLAYDTDVFRGVGMRAPLPRERLDLDRKDGQGRMKVVGDRLQERRLEIVALAQRRDACPLVD